MREGICPKCGSTDVHTGAHFPNKEGHYWANTIPITFWVSTALDNFVCVSCGYVESYISNPAKLRKIMEKWPRVRQHEHLLPGSSFSRGRICPTCDNMIGDDWKACPYCGQVLV